MDCQMAARRRAAGMELPMMSRNTCSKAHWIWRKQAKGGRGGWLVGGRPAAGGVGLGRGGSEGGCEEVAVVTLIEQVQDRVFIEYEVRRAGFAALAQASLELLGQRFEALDDAPDVGARLLGVVDVLAPDRLAGDEGVAQRCALEFDPFGEEGVRVDELGDGGEEAALLWGEEGHMHILVGQARS